MYVPAYIQYIHEGLMIKCLPSLSPCVQDIIRFILDRLRVNMEVARQLFGILLKHNHSHEAYWLQSGFTVQVRVTCVFVTIATGI